MQNVIQINSIFYSTFFLVNFPFHFVFGAQTNFSHSEAAGKLKRVCNTFVHLHFWKRATAECHHYGADTFSVFADVARERENQRTISNLEGRKEGRNRNRLLCGTNENSSECAVKELISFAQFALRKLHERYVLSFELVLGYLELILSPSKASSIRWHMIGEDDFEMTCSPIDEI